MFKFGDELTLDNVLKLVSPYQIFKFYQPELNVGKVTNSPFRKDSRPSFGLFVDKDSGDVLYNDLGDTDSGNWIKYLKKLYNIEFYDVLRLVNRDMNLGLSDYSSKSITTKQVKSSIVKDVSKEELMYDLKLYVNKRAWLKHDIKYWSDYGISIELLGKDTYPISSYWFNDWTSIMADPYAYGYDFYYDGSILRRKIYQPYSKTDKWKTNLNTLVIDGIKDIPKQGKLLIITKSRKDRLVLKSLGGTSIATNNESSWIPDVNFNKLNERYDRIVVFFDNDEAGMKNSLKFSEKYKIDRMFIPEHYADTTDIADFRKKYGEIETRQLLNKLLE